MILSNCFRTVHLPNSFSDFPAEMKLNLLSVSAIVYIMLLIYASFMPFDFSLDGIDQKLSLFWNQWPINPEARISGSDVLSNLVLYTPLGWMLATRIRLGRGRVPRSLTLSTLVCSAISLFVEVTQLGLVHRIGSASDWLLNTMSGFTGAVLGVLCGIGIWLSSVRWIRRSWKTHPVDIATLFLMVLLAADALAPYLPTILLKQVWASIKKSKLGLSAGLAVHPWHWWLVCRALVYAILTCMLSAWGGRKPGCKDWIGASAVVASFALCLELGKLIIVSRFFNLANVVVAWGGCVGAVCIGAFGICQASESRKINFAIVAILAYLFYLSWTPFNFVWDSKMLQRALFFGSATASILPLRHGRDAEPCEAIRSKCFFYGIVGLSISRSLRTFREQSLQDFDCYDFQFRNRVVSGRWPDFPSLSYAFNDRGILFCDRRGLGGLCIEAARKLKIESQRLWEKRSEDVLFLASKGFKAKACKGTKK